MTATKISRWDSCPDLSAICPDRGALYRSPQWWSVYTAAQKDGRAAEFVVAERGGEVTAVLPLFHGVRRGGGDDHVTRYLQPWLGRVVGTPDIVMAGSWNSGRFSPLMQEGAELDLMAAGRAAADALVPGQILMWSYLDEKFARMVHEEFPQALVLPCDSDGVIDLGSNGFESWLSTLSGSRRHKVRRELDKFAGSGAVVDIQPVGDRIPALAQLLAAHKASHGGMGDPSAMARLLAGQVEVFGDCLLSIESHLDGRLHAACTVIRHEDAMYCRSFGAVDDDVPFEYFVLGYYTPIQCAGELAVRYLHLGRGTEGAKRHRGADFTPRWTAFLGLDGVDGAMQRGC